MCIYQSVTESAHSPPWPSRKNSLSDSPTESTVCLTASLLLSVSSLLAPIFGSSRQFSYSRCTRISDACVSDDAWLDPTLSQAHPAALHTPHRQVRSHDLISCTRDRSIPPHYLADLSYYFPCAWINHCLPHSCWPHSFVH